MVQNTIQKETTVARKTGRVSLWLIGLLTIIASVVANLIARAIAFALVPLSEAFLSLQWESTVFMTVIGVTGAVGVYALVRRFARKPARTYLVIAVIALLLSFIPNILMMMDPVTTSSPGYSVQAVWVLIVQHIVPAIVSVWMLITLVRPVEKRVSAKIGK